MRGGDDEGCVSILKRFADHVRSRPDAEFFCWVNGKGRATARYTLSSFDAASEAVATALPIVRGQRVLLSYTPSVDFYVAFWACFRIGAVPIPVAPAFSEADADRLLLIAADSKAEVVLTNSQYARFKTLKMAKVKAKRLFLRASHTSGFAGLGRLKWISLKWTRRKIKKGERNGSSIRPNHSMEKLASSCTAAAARQTRRDVSPLTQICTIS